MRNGCLMRYKIISWWSAGITSAVACKFALQQYGSDNIDLVYIDTGSAHSDNDRFKKDCENWYGQKINTIKSDKFSNVLEVVAKGWINSPYGAACTKQLKKDVRIKYEKDNEFSGQIFGFEFSKKEINRAIRFKEQNPNTLPLYPLIEHQLTKANCGFILENQGIELPTMYKLGYSNNNCLMCVKGGKGYFNKMRIDFPNEFDDMAKMERTINASCLNGTYLDELDENAGRMNKIIMPECDLFCEIEFTNLISDKVDKILKGHVNII